MTEYNVYDKATGEFILGYWSPDGSPIELAGYGFDNYNHVAVVVSAPVEKIAPTDPFSSLIDIGPYFDRFGSAKLPVLASSDPTVQAIIRDVSIRKWIDLTRTEVMQAVEYIASKVTELTPELVTTVLTVPVLPLENAALRASGYIS